MCCPGLDSAYPVKPITRLAITNKNHQKPLYKINHTWLDAVCVWLACEPFGFSVFLNNHCSKEDWQMKRSITESKVALGIAALLGSGMAGAAQVNSSIFLGPMAGHNSWTTDSGNITMLEPNGAISSGTNDLNFSWDGTVFTDSSDYTGPGSVPNVTAFSTTIFANGDPWSFHSMQMFAPGSYTFDTTLGSDAPGSNDNEVGSLSMNVASGQIGAHMLMDWSGNSNIDFVMVFDQGAVFGSGVGAFTDGVSSCGLLGGGSGTNCLWDGPNLASAGAPSPTQMWTLTSIDADGDGTPGVPAAAGGPFSGKNFNLNLNLSPVVVPVPAAAWLFGSGLLGLIGMARKKAA